MATEKRLIYLEDAIAKIVDTPSAIAERVFNGDYGYDQNPDVLVDRQHEIIDLLMDVPTVEVVRCKDCIHWHETEGVCLKIYSDGAVSAYAWQFRKPDDYCSYGERKDNER